VTQSRMKPEVQTVTWRIPPSVWMILLSWGLAVLLIAVLLSVWIRANQRQQDHDMCTMIGVFLGGPEPVAGPAGERSRVVRDAMESYYQRRHCANT
jgi:hypothetical protein